jgi:hypothetical protein
MFRRARIFREKPDKADVWSGSGSQDQAAERPGFVQAPTSGSLGDRE